MSISVRYAKREELERVNELREKVFKIHANGIKDIFRKDFCDEFKNYVYEQYDAEDADVLVAVADDKICGFAIVLYFDKPRSACYFPKRFYHIDKFGVDENFRQMGVASEMISFMREDASRRGFHKIELDMWEFNSGALKFYENAGFKTYRRIMELEI